MATETPETTQQDSAAAEARKTIDGLKTENADLKAQVVALGQKNHVERYVRANGIVENDAVDQWVSTLMPTAGSINFEDADQFQQALGDRFGHMMPKPQAPADDTPAPPTEGVQTPTQPAVDLGNTPAFAQPNPGAQGTPPGETVYSLGDDYIQGLLQAGRVQEVEALFEAGRLKGTPRGGRFPIERR